MSDQWTTAEKTIVANAGVWRDIPSWPNYSVSATGLVQRKATGRVMRLRPHENQGHLYFVPKRGKKCYVHRAVLEAFIGPWISFGERRRKTRLTNGVMARSRAANTLQPQSSPRQTSEKSAVVSQLPRSASSPASTVYPTPLFAARPTALNGLTSDE